MNKIGGNYLGGGEMVRGVGTKALMSERSREGAPTRTG